MIGYIFETTNTKTGQTYLGKHFSVKFDPNFLGDSEELAVDIEKYGRPVFKAKMIMPYESMKDIDTAFEAMTKEVEPVAEVKEEPVVEEPKEEVKKPRKKRSKVEDK